MYAVIGGSYSLNADSKERYVRSYRNLVRAVVVKGKERATTKGVEEDDDGNTLRRVVRGGQESMRQVLEARRVLGAVCVPDHSVVGNIMR